MLCFSHRCLQCQALRSRLVVNGLLWFLDVVTARGLCFCLSSLHHMWLIYLCLCDVCWYQGRVLSTVRYLHWAETPLSIQIGFEQVHVVGQFWFLGHLCHAGLSLQTQLLYLVSHITALLKARVRTNTSFQSSLPLHKSNRTDSHCPWNFWWLETPLWIFVLRGSWLWCFMASLWYLSKMSLERPAVSCLTCCCVVLWMSEAELIFVFEIKCLTITWIYSNLERMRQSGASWGTPAGDRNLTSSSRHSSCCGC